MITAALTLFLLSAPSKGISDSGHALVVEAKGPPKPAWLSSLGRHLWLDWSADFWRIPNLDANPLLLGVARFRAPLEKVAPQLERRLGPRGGQHASNPIFSFERHSVAFFGRVVPVQEVDSGRRLTELYLVESPTVPKDCVVQEPPGARVLDERWRFGDEGEYSRPQTIAAFAGGGNDRRLRGHFLRTLVASRRVTHGAKTWVAGRACGIWVMATFQDQTPWDEKAWVTRVVPAPSWLVTQLEPDGEARKE